MRNTQILSPGLVFSTVLMHLTVLWKWIFKKRAVRGLNTLAFMQVSIVVLLNKVPASMCAHVNRQLFEVLWASAPVHSPAFTLIVPAITSVPLSALEKEGQDNDVAICKAVLYGASEVHKGVYSGLPRLAPTFPLRDGFLAYLMQFVHISSLPTLLILGSSKADTSEVHTLNCRGAMSSNVWSSQQEKMNLKFIACHHLFDNSLSLL